MEQDKIYSWVKAKDRLPECHKSLNLRVYGRSLSGQYKPAGYFNTTLGRYTVEETEWLEEQTGKVAISKERYEAFQNCFDILYKISFAPTPYNSNEVFSFVDTAKSLSHQALTQLKETEPKQIS